jgi:hypothetical protein
MALLPKRFDSGLTPAEAFRSCVITVVAGLALGLISPFCAPCCFAEIAVSEV